jgi:hypothetical protein
MVAERPADARRAVARALKTDYKTLHVKIKSPGIARRDFPARQAPRA